MFVTLPFFIPFDRWVNLLKVDLAPNIIVPGASKEEKWWEWAALLIVQNNLGVLPIPNKLAYPGAGDWKKWACQVLPTVK